MQWKQTPEGYCLLGEYKPINFGAKEHGKIIRCTVFGSSVEHWSCYVNGKLYKAGIDNSEDAMKYVEVCVALTEDKP